MSNPNASGSADTAYGGACRIGYYCPAGAVVEIPCTPGYACTLVKQAAPDEVCPQGYYCSR